MRPRAPSARRSSTAARGHEVPPGDDRDRLAEPLDELELVAREEHRGAVPGSLHEHRGEGVDGHRIEAGEGLVEDQDVRLVHQRGGQLDALLVSQRQRLDAVVTPVGDAQRRDPAGGRGVRLGGARAVQPGEVDELLVHPHARVQPALLRHVAEPPPVLVAHRPAVEPDACRRRAPGDPSRSASWWSSPPRSGRRSHAAARAPPRTSGPRWRRGRRTAGSARRARARRQPTVRARAPAPVRGRWPGTIRTG